MFSRRSFDPPQLPQETGNVARDYAALRNHVGHLQRWVASVFRQLNQPGSVTISQGKIDDTNIGDDKAGAGSFTTLAASGNVTLGDAFTDTLNVGNGDIIKDASGNAGFGVTPSYKLCSSTGKTWAAQVVANNAAETHVVGIKAPTDGASADRSDITFGTTAGSGGSDSYIKFNTNHYGVAYAERMQIDKDGNVTIGTAALGTTATNGFLYIPSCAGAPTGTPTTKTGRIPLIYDSTNNKLYAYNGAWKSVALA